MSLITGSTNTDGSGSAANLTVENGHEIDLSEYTTYESDNGGYRWTIVDGNTTVSMDADHHGYYDLRFTNTAEWNAEGQKEISVDMIDFASEIGHGGYDAITINNYVDVNLHTVDINHQGPLYYYIEGAKRGTLDFSDDVSVLVRIDAQSNGASWGNLFEVTGSRGYDEIQIRGGEDTQYTEFSIDLGAGNDEFSSTLTDAIYASQTRFVDGGEGTDTIHVYNNESTDTIADVDFINFEIIDGDDYDITLTEYVLTNNGTEDEPLIVETTGELDFAGDVDSITASESDYDEGFYEVSVDYGDTSYTIITNAIDEAWLA